MLIKRGVNNIEINMSKIKRESKEIVEPENSERRWVRK